MQDGNETDGQGLLVLNRYPEPPARHLSSLLQLGQEGLGEV